MTDRAANTPCRPLRPGRAGGRVRKSARLLAASAALALCAAEAGAAAPTTEVPRLQASEPRAFGWQLGDVVERELVLELPPGWRLLGDSLPTPRANGRSLELRSLQRDSAAGQERLRLRYQVMRSPVELRALEIAAIALQVQGPQRSETLRVDAWPLLVAPLSPTEVLNRRGLGELQPDRPPPLPRDAGRPYRLGVEVGLLLLAASGLAWARWGAWWRARPQRPITAVARQLRRPLRQAVRAELRQPSGDASPALARQHDSAALQAMLRAVHAALNLSAGQVLLAQGVPAYCRARPAFAPLQDDLLQFFALSDALFFADQPAPAQAASQLQRWLQRWRRAEQGR